MSLRVLLICPGDIIDESKEFFSLHKSLKKLRSLPSLGLSSLSAILKAENHKCLIVDAFAEQLTKEQLLSRVEKFAPDFIGVTSTTPFYKMASLTCRCLKERFPNIPVILGGPHVTVMKKDALLEPSVDYGVIGEGEQTLLALLTALAKKEPIDDIPNVIHRVDGQLLMNEIVDQRLDINELPIPDRSDLPLDSYYDSLSLHGKAMSMMTTRGCPFRCLFCEADVRGGRYRAREVSLVIDEMKHIVNELGFPEIVIYDDTFTVNRKRTVAICEAILKDGLKFSWDCRTRVDCVDEELLALMKRAGCHRISFGVEAASERVREVLRKDITDEQIRNAFLWSRCVGIRTIGYFMLGTPTETKEEIEQTIKYAIELSPDIAHFCITAPYPGTDLYRMGVSMGVIPDDFWQCYVGLADEEHMDIPYFTSKGLSRQDLDKLLKKAYRDFYFRLGYIGERLTVIRSLGELWWHIKLAKELACLALL